MTVLKRMAEFLSQAQRLYDIECVPYIGVDAMPRTQPSLPAKRAFVVQVHADAQVEQHDCKGRVERLVPGEATHFDFLEELITFIMQTLTEQPQFHILRKVVKGESHLCAPNYCLRYRPAARQPQMIDTGMSHIGIRCIVRKEKRIKVKE